MLSKGRDTPRHPNPSALIAIRPAAAAAAAVLILAATSSPDSRAATVNSTWNATTGILNWSDPLRWTNSPAADTFPDNGRLGNTYDVVISQGGPVLDTSVTVRSVTLTGSSQIYTNLYTSSQTRYAGTNTLSVTNSFTLDSPNLFVNVNAPSGAIFTLTNPAKTKLLAGAINIGGEMRLAPVAGTYLIDTVTVGTAINLLPTSLFTIDRPFGFAPQSNDPFQLPVNGTLNNAGVIQQTAAGTFTGGSWWKIENSGTIHVNGTFNVPGGFHSTGLLDLQSASGIASLSNSSLAGQITLAPGSALTIGGPTSFGDVLANLSVTNAGTIQFLNATYVTGSTTISGPGQVNFATSAARVNLQADLTLSGPTLLDGGASVQGTYRATVGNLTFKSGRITGSELFVPVGGALAFAGTNAHNLDGATVTVAGNATWDGGNIAAVTTPSNRIQIQPSGAFTILPSAGAALTRTPSGSQTDLLANAGLLNVDRGALAVGQSWNLDNSGTLRVTGGTLTLSVLAATNSGTIDLQPGGTFLANGLSTTRIEITPTGTLRIAPSAAATFHLPSQSGATLVNKGLIEVGGGTFILDGTWNLSNSGTVRVTAGFARIATGRFTNTGSIELESGAAALDIGSIDSVRAMIVSGNHAGAWDGAGVRSAAARSNHALAVGYAYGADISSASTFQWMGASVSASDILVRTTLIGDANLDGSVDFNDLVKLAQNYNTAIPTPSGKSAWVRGDFTYDGVIDFNDLVKLAQNYNTALPAEPIPGSSPNFNADLARAFASVPEPSAIALFATAGAILGRRRRR